MNKIKLEIAEWKYDTNKQLGPEGGFGVVFQGTGAKFGSVAVKRLKISVNQAAHRELKIAKELSARKLANVIPVYDSGQDANSNLYFVVMALAEKSLEDDFKGNKVCDDIRAVAILLDIANGLSEVSDIVHRDLKPGNVLYHEGKWKVADFGIARFVEDATSLHTLKGWLSQPYAAPEQWNSEHTTTATDIYALGCIGYFLLTGHPPFQGPNEADFKRQHLSETPPRIESHCPQLTSLFAMMLRKTQEARPNLKRVMDILKEIAKNPDTGKSKKGFDTLVSAGAEVASRQAEEEAKIHAEKAEEERRRRISAGAEKLLIGMRSELFDRICRATPAATQTRDVISLGDATLYIPLLYSNQELAKLEVFPQSKWDVLSAAEIIVKQKQPEYEWSASLWYSKPPTDNEYRWREVSYFVNPLLPQYYGMKRFQPFALRDLSYADRAASPVMDVYQIAYGPKVIDDECFEDFCQIWAERLAAAARGQLRHPPRLPLE
jgi:serine/threonine-protein kinase